MRAARHNLHDETDRWLPARIDTLVRVRPTGAKGAECSRSGVVDGEPLGFETWPGEPEGPLAEGLTVIPDVISAKDELQILEAVEKTPWVFSLSGRRKQDFGPKVNFKKRKVKPGAFVGLPRYGQELLPRLREAFGSLLPPEWQAHEMVVLEYERARASNMANHIDDLWAWGPHILGVTLGAGGWMLFVPPRASVAYEMWMAPRSVYLLRGRVRQAWLHGVRYGLAGDVARPRISLTFRELGQDVLSTEVGREIANLARQTVGG